MSVKESPKQTTKQYELVAPDGGWGYMIWISVTINMIAISSFVSCLGMMYSDIFDELKMGSTEVTLLNGISAMSISVAGFMTGPLLKCMSVRKLGFLAAIVFNVGSFGVAFVHSRALFYLSCGVLQNMGNGVLFNISSSTITEYFVKKRLLSITVTQTIAAVAALFTPLLVKWAAEEYGGRGSLILVSAIYMHVFVALALMQPVSWHMKKVEIPPSKETEMKPLICEDASQDKSKIETSEIKLPDDRISNEPIGSKYSNEDVKKDSFFKMMFKDLLDVPFLKSFLLSNASVGLSTCAFCEVTFILMLPQALYSMGWTEGKVAWVLSLNNFGDLVTKIIFIFFNSVFLKFGSADIYVSALTIAFFSRLGMLWSDNEIVIISFITMMGISRCVVSMFIPLVIAECVNKEKFTSAIGIFMLLYGIISLILGPVIGAVRDLTNSYATAFYIITSCYGIVIMFWSIELLYKKNKHKRAPKKEVGSA